MIQTIFNEKLIVRIETFGAEIKSVMNQSTKKEYIWYGDEKYWKRSAPILFPFVGASKDGKYSYNGKEYKIMQHGFARDMEFSVINKSNDEIWFSLLSNDETYAIYPFDFELQIGYKLTENQLCVFWKVINNSNGEMYFSIGAHPAFLCEGEKSNYIIRFDSENPLYCRGINNETGLALNEKIFLKVSNGKLNLTNDFFDRSALIFEDNQVHKVSIEDVLGNRIISIEFDAPLFGIWSPEGKNAPFICIEPWYGRCDSVDFSGDLRLREYSNVLDKEKIFNAEYKICFYYF